MILLPLILTKKVFIKRQIMSSNWNSEAFLISLGPMRSMSSELLTLFKNSLKTYTERLNIALTTNDFEKIRIIAHSIKGSSGQLHFMDLQNISEQLEKYSEQKNQIEIKIKSQELTRQIKIEKIAIEEFIRGQDIL